jgi:hypothetical protein
MMKVIAMKMIARMMASLCIESQEFSIVPFVGAILVFGPVPDKAALDAIPYLLAENLENGLCSSLSYQITQSLNIPPKRSLTKIKANAPHNQNEKHPLSLPTNSSVSLFLTSICFLHACTPARLHACTGYTRSGNEQTVRDNTQKNISFKKTIGVLKRWANIVSGAASEPHRLKYIVVG